MGAHGSDVEASDVKDAEVVCIRAIEKREASPLDRAQVGQSSRRVGGGPTGVVLTAGLAVQ